MQDLNDMLYFTEIVAQGGFAAAGRSLGMPKSKLSRRFAQLEGHLGVRLLQRTTRKLALTPVGETYLRHCQAMREQAQAAQEAVAQAQTAPCGRVRVACPVTLAQSAMAGLLPGFLLQYPQVSVDMKISNRAVDLVEDGFDVALRVRSSLEDSASLVVKNLGQSGNLLVASPAQLLRQGRPESVQDLARLDTVDMAARDGQSSWSLVGPGGHLHTHSHQPRVALDDLATLKVLVMQGIGMCFMPDYLCKDEIAQGTLVEVLPGWAPQPGLVHAVFPTRRGMLPAVRCFLDYLGEHFVADGQITLHTTTQPRPEAA